MIPQGNSKYNNTCLAHFRRVWHTSDMSGTLQVRLTHFRHVWHTLCASGTLQARLEGFRRVWHASDTSDTVSSLKNGELIIAKSPSFAEDASDTFY